MPAYAGRFAPLVAFLDARPDYEVELSLDAIAAIVGRPLPPRDHANSDRWSSPQYPHVRRWQALGWRAELDRRRRCVRFVRDGG